MLGTVIPRLFRIICALQLCTLIFRSLREGKSAKRDEVEKHIFIRMDAMIPFKCGVQHWNEPRLGHRVSFFLLIISAQGFQWNNAAAILGQGFSEQSAVDCQLVYFFDI